MASASTLHPPADSVVDRGFHSSGDQLTVLLVDDSSTIRNLIAAKLRDLSVDTYDIDIAQADSGEDAVQSARARHFDVIFLDVEMPGIGGLEACRQLKASTASRVVMLSSMTSAEAHEAGRSAGCDNYLTKPPHDADLRSILRLVSLRKLASA